MKQRKVSLVISGVGAALALALSGPALAGNKGGQHGGGDKNTTTPTQQNVDNKHFTFTKVFTATHNDHSTSQSFRVGDISVDIAVASTSLTGHVYGNHSDGIRGNTGGAGGVAGNGANGGSGGAATNNSLGTGSATVGGGGAGGHALGLGVGISSAESGGNDANNGAASGPGNSHKSHSKGSTGSGSGWANASSSSTSGDAGGTGGGNAGGDGGWGGMAKSGSVLAMATSGNGAMGGSGGSANGGAAGSFVAANTISNSAFAGGAGIMNVSQNMGENSLVQQGVTVQGNLNF
ncbi:hypothetical protein VRY85_04955 [Achromobacter sp. F4_2707]|uniref:hypothetical protein n=1 Tax=Achromobacter sp. F4_2707 TaxID=3114286 RepID=UPI0039C6720B